MAMRLFLIGYKPSIQNQYTLTAEYEQRSYESSSLYTGLPYLLLPHRYSFDI